MHKLLIRYPRTTLLAADPSLMTDEQLNILFGSKTRVKLLRHFLADPGQKYYVRELTRLLSDHINAIRHELGNLENAGLVSKKKSQGRLYYRLNQAAPGVAELRNLFVKPETQPAPEQRWALSSSPGERSAAPNLGNVKLLVMNGKFVGSQDAPADLLIVGQVDRELLQEYLDDLQDKHGDIRYSLMAEPEYLYRRQLFDRFITLMLTEPKKVVINQLKDRQLVNP